MSKKELLLGLYGCMARCGELCPTQSKLYKFCFFFRQIFPFFMFGEYVGCTFYVYSSQHQATSFAWVAKIFVTSTNQYHKSNIKPCSAILEHASFCRLFSGRAKQNASHLTPAKLQSLEKEGYFLPPSLPRKETIFQCKPENLLID